jgi:hypothetical protein
LPRIPLNEWPQLDYFAFSQGFPDYKPSMLRFCAEEESNNIVMNKITDIGSHYQVREKESSVKLWPIPSHWSERQIMFTKYLHKEWFSGKHKVLNNGSASTVKFTMYKQTLNFCCLIGFPAHPWTKCDSGSYDYTS